MSAARLGHSAALTLFYPLVSCELNTVYSYEWSENQVQSNERSAQSYYSTVKVSQEIVTRCAEQFLAHRNEIGAARCDAMLKPVFLEKPYLNSADKSFQSGNCEELRVAARVRPQRLRLEPN